MALVPIIMGSKSDLEHGKKVAAALTALGVRSELRVASAHKSPEHVMAIVRHYEALAEPKVYVTIAGRSNALSGMVDAAVTAPVVACPVYSDRFGGADVFSSIRVPSGVAPALILDTEGAGLLVAKILALAEPAIGERIHALQQRHHDRLIADDAELHGR
ncbi:MAG: 5-(carboxyamino)imidazole ribonucleotide mutase [Deltaproteobacteria bacterium HGW-Deltaproteobacteria-14]|jgi:phosphoribosylaminoimidazole carboxylase PurE protein|nr:MAG: 5-(carboxyamino)imidazole ribonucleotide mutase [Deltaproteobacteria bacterium HGW-Deltaproteobacteria-14]